MEVYNIQSSLDSAMLTK